MKSKKGFVLVLILIIIIVGVVFGFVYYKNKSSENISKLLIPGMPNPSSVNCGNNGFKNLLDSAGSVGYCLFKDGTACEEWAYYNNKCVPGGNNSYDYYDELGGSISRINEIEIIPTGSPTDVNTKDYCIKKGNIFNPNKQKLVNHLIGYYISKGGELIKTYKVDVIDISCCNDNKINLDNSIYVCK